VSHLPNLVVSLYFWHKSLEIRNLRFNVSVVRGKDPEKMVKKAIDSIGGAGSFIRANEKVFVKPNLGTLKKSETGATTDPRIVGAVIDLIQERTSDVTIIESDSAATDAEIIWSHCGYYELAREKNVNLVNLSKEPTLIHEGYRLPRILFGDHVLVSIPKIKTNDLTTVTCSLKNLFGLIPTRHRAKYHKHISQVIVDLNRIFKSNLVVVDGLIGMEGDGPLVGQPVTMNVVIAGDNPVAVDSVVCNIIGVNPKDIDHIMMAVDARLGQMDMHSINLLGERLEDVSRNFALPSTIPFMRRLRYKMLEHSEKAVLKQAVGILRRLRRREGKATRN